MSKEKIYGHRFYKSMDGKKERDVLNYKCGYCGYRFKHYVRFTEKHGSTKIVCPICGNGLPTESNK